MATTAKITMSEIKVMNLDQVNNALAAGGLNAAQKQALSVRKTQLEAAASEVKAPVETLQENTAADSVTAPEAAAQVQKAPEATAPVVKAPKNKPFETTRTITAFADDTKGIRAGDMVNFTEHKGGSGKPLTGQVQRLFDFYAKPERQEAKIMVTDAKGNKTRYYRFEKDLTKVEAPKAEEPAASEGSGI